jgi:hypothetical protein
MHIYITYRRAETSLLSYTYIYVYVYVHSFTFEWTYVLHNYEREGRREETNAMSYIPWILTKQGNEM